MSPVMKRVIKNTLEKFLRHIPSNSKQNPEPRACCLMSLLMAQSNPLTVGTVTALAGG